MTSNHLITRAAGLLLTLVFTSSLAWSQGENNNWHFGHYAGISFNQTTPATIPSSLRAIEGCASVSGTAGQLKFYSNGNTVWDRNGNAMPNGTGILGNQPSSGFNPIPASSSQGVHIVQFPADTNKYYLFVLDAGEAGPPGYLRYSVVDMTLNNGLGDITATQKNIVLQDSCSEAAVTIRGDGCYTWFVAHNRFQEEFFAYKIDISGLDTIPVRSYSGLLMNYGFTACMTVSPDRSKLFYFTPHLIEYHEFDPSTGIFGNFAALDTTSTQQFYSGVVSPDGSKLYVCTWGGLHFRQYDLSLLPNMQAVTASKYLFGVTGYFPNVRVSPDNRIIVAQPANNSLGIIHNPNMAGASCGFQPNAISLGSYPYSMKSLGAPFVVNYIDTFRSVLDTGSCFLTPFAVNAPAGYDEYHWSDGLPGTSRTLIGPDTLWLVSVNGCNVRVDSFKIHSIPVNQSHYVHDTSICFTGSAHFYAAPGYQNYLWSTGSISTAATLFAPDTIWVRASSGCNIRTDTFKVSAIQVQTAIFHWDTAVCFPATIQVSAPPGYTSRLWHDADTVFTRTFNSLGTYWVESYAACQHRVDTFSIRDTVYQSASSTDTTVCFSGPVQLDATPGYPGYIWSNGSTGPSTQVTAPGWYWVAGTSGCYQHTDSFLIKAASVDTTYYSADTVLCFKNEMQLQGPAGYVSYTWSDQDTGRTRLVDSSGWYTLMSGEGCNLRIDSFLVELVNFEVDLGNDTSICPGDQLHLSAGQGADSYIWQDGSTNPDYTVSNPGTYAVTVQILGCIATDTIELEERTLSLDLGPDTLLCDKDMLVLDPGFEGPIIWQDGSIGNFLEVREPGTYSAEIRLAGCSARDTVEIQYQLCKCRPIIPSAFTPNFDGINDLFRVKIDCDHSHFQLMIYNRWGQQVFSTTGAGTGWDGTHLGAPAASGVYYYFVRFTGPLYRNYEFKGDLLLLR